MSDRSAKYVKEKLKRLAEAARMLGSKLSDPFMAMAFLTLPPIPEIRITDRGVIDAVKFSVTDLFRKGKK
jgi:adenine deaminase